MAKQITIGGIDTLLLEYEKLTKPVTVGDISTIVAESLDCLDDSCYRHEIEARGESVVYTIYKNNAFMGKFRISRSDDARRTIKYGSINFSSDPELGREWHSIVYKMLYIDIARRIEARDATQTEPLTTQAQSPAPKTTKWTTDRVALETYRGTVKMLRANYVLVILTILMIFVAILGLPFLQGTIQHFLYGATPTLTPMLAPPTATP